MWMRGRARRASCRHACREAVPRRSPRSLSRRARGRHVEGREHHVKRAPLIRRLRISGALTLSAGFVSAKRDGKHVLTKTKSAMRPNDIITLRLVFPTFSMIN